MSADDIDLTLDHDDLDLAAELGEILDRMDPDEALAFADAIERGLADDE